MRMYFVLLSLSVASLLSPSVAQAAARFDASIQMENISLAKGQHATEQQPIRVYATITNDGTEDIEGLVRFFDNEQFIGGKVFSLRSGTRPEDAWVLWTPKASGEHMIRIEIANDAEFPDATPGNNTASSVFVVHQDLDQDGIANEYDKDIDGDGVMNIQETANGTNLYKKDSDEDGAEDGADAYPLDPTRQTAPPPAPTPSPIVPTPTPTPTPTPSPTPTPARVEPSRATTPITKPSTITPSEPTPPVTTTSIVETPPPEPIAAPNPVPPEPTPPPPSSPTVSRLAWYNQPSARALIIAAAVTASAGLSALGISFFLRKPM